MNQSSTALGGSLEPTSPRADHQKVPSGTLSRDPHQVGDPHLLLHDRGVEEESKQPRSSTKSKEADSGKRKAEERSS
ncbi:unnamed protein product [Arabis nemorensis]|uniref:Uncharacterized protein n=1 Tax=Arabis nemorensis TaxID=586526 RepID=A0A565AYC0_9BRAS|nr:unnamed protein product [Arabis nemorensis]